MIFCPPPFMGHSKQLVLIDRTSGTNIGTMTAGGGLASAFDGNTNQASSVSAVSPSAAASGYVGKTLAAPRVIGRVVTYGSNNLGYRSGAAGSNITLSLYAKNGASPTSATDGTLLGTTSFFANTYAANPKTIDSSDLTTAWAHVWAAGLPSGTAQMVFAELQLYAWE
ncbi:hypothetical protein [Kaistia sp. UC242_56]|uniref:hypothetical protein n=1 Tax=Kaistia sp. UC242_56 TaxID=3374625 RepID=UPI0037A5AD85